MATRLRRLTGQTSAISSDGKTAPVTVEYALTGEPDNLLAESFAVLNCPTYESGRILDDVSLEERSDLRDGAYLVKAQYRAPNPNDDDEGGDPPPDFVHDSTTFQIVSPLKHLSHSRSTIQKYKATGITDAFPDFKQGINVVDGIPQGADISLDGIPVSLDFSVKASLITNAWIAGVEAVVLKTNSAGFKGRAIGEVIFAGLRGNIKHTDDRASLSFEFVISKNEAGLAIGPFTGVDKKGWEFAWVFSRLADGTEGAVMLPRFLLVERLFESDSFASLGVGA